MKLDRDARMTGAEAVYVASKATELFVSDLLDLCVSRAANRGRAAVRAEDVEACARASDRLAFLTDVMHEVIPGKPASD